MPPNGAAGDASADRSVRNGRQDAQEVSEGRKEDRRQVGGAQKILDVNYYKHSHASLCLVLPPVGSARSAILLLECIEHFIGSALFGNPEVQIQVCSPGRLGARRSALLAIGFYLGSDTLRRYTLGDLATSFTKHQHYPRGRRLVLYDAEGDFDRNFEWWKQSGKHRLL